MKNFDDFVRLNHSSPTQHPTDPPINAYPGSNLLSRPDVDVEDEEYDDPEPDENGIQLLADDKVLSPLFSIPFLVTDTMYATESGPTHD